MCYPSLFVAIIKLDVILMWRRRLGLDMLLCFCFILSILLRLLHEASVLCSIVGATAAALHPQYVERHCAVCLAVIAHYLWQRKQNYICRKSAKG